MADLIYLLLAYWPYIAGVFAIGILVGWWAEGARDSTDVSAWLERGPDEP